MKKMLLPCLWAFTFCLFGSCAKNPVTGKRNFVLLSQEQELAMGKQADPEIVNYFGLYPDKTLQKLIQEKGQQMAAISHRNDLTYQFKIVDSPVVNAFAVPGGYVYFTRGIMAHFNNEAEFAGVLGHEIGHVAARHSAQAYSRSLLAQLGLVAGMVIAPELSQFADLAQTGVGLLFLKFGRDDERESDRLGVEYSTKIGYDAQEMAEFFRTLDRLAKQTGAAEVPAFLSTHPDPLNRYERVTKLAAEWQDKLDKTVPEVNRNRYLKMIDGLVYGEDPRQGYVEGSTFYHPELKFQFRVPGDWALHNAPQQVQMAPKGGKALMTLTLVPGASLQTAAEAVIQKNGLTLLESGNVQVNGLPAIALVAGQEQAQQNVRALFYLIQYGNAIYQLMGISNAGDFSNYIPLFKATMTSFRQVDDPEKLNRQPDRIRIKGVRKTGTLAAALRELGTPEDKIPELSILNGMQPEARVEQGTLVKVIDQYEQ